MGDGLKENGRSERKWEAAGEKMGGGLRENGRWPEKMGGGQRKWEAA